MKRLVTIFLLLMSLIGAKAQCCNNDSMIVRIAEIEVYPEYISEYLSAAAEIGGISVREETGVVCIFPMQMKEDKTKIRILEIYRSPSAYQSHLNSAHFLKYKNGTLKMVKSLKLPEMQPLDPAAMPLIFDKMDK